MIIKKRYRYMGFPGIRKSALQKKDEIWGGDKTFLSTMVTHPAVNY